MKSKEDWALAIARQGLRVFPLVPNEKRPAIDDWQRKATTNVEQISKWWGGRFTKANIGIPTGNGLIVLDCDSKGGRKGLESLDMLDLEGLPESFRVKTPSGGVHVYLSYDPSLHISGRVDPLEGYPGIDTRADGNLVAGPGSTIDGVPYEIL